MEVQDRVNILLVDDQPAKLLSYEAMLSGLGENLIKANSGREALEHLLREDITIVLMDVSMPELDGFELAEIIRQHPRYQKTAIIFVSAVQTTDLDRLKGYESGAVDYVSVPVIPQLLRAKVRVFAELYRKTRAFERLNRELEDRVAGRTAELEEAVRAQVELSDRLRDADRRKDEFLALLAHELRNPLAPIVNAVEVMRLESGLSPERAWCREVIDRQARHLTRLVDDLLDVNRITRGRLELKLEPIRLDTALRAALETARPLVAELGHTLVIDGADTPVVLLADPVRLAQVLSNLLNNAARYTDPGGTIRLGVERAQGEVTVTVTDSGIGIPRDALATVFDLFNQVDRSLERSRSGLGIGLTLVKRLVEMHGGHVSAHSDGPGTGATFRVHLPVLVEPESTTGLAPRTPVRAADGLPLGRRVLIADDNRDSAESMALILRMMGNEVLTVHDGAAALREAERFAPEVALLDIGMPEMNGYDVARAMRAAPWGRDVLLVALTGWGQDDDRKRSTGAGFDFHFTKPLEPTDLAKVVGLRRTLAAPQIADGEPTTAG